MSAAVVELGASLCDQSLGLDLDPLSTNCAYLSLGALARYSAAARPAEVWAHPCPESLSLAHRVVLKARLISSRVQGHVVRRTETWALEEHPEVGSCWSLGLV